jgi:hypothetical protein
LALAAAWSFVLLIICLTLPVLLERSRGWRSFPWLWIAALALLIRLVPNLLVPAGSNFDNESFRILGGLTSAGENVYASPLAVDRHPYLPFFIYWIGLASRIADGSDPVFTFLLRLLPILGDVGICLVIYRMMLRLGRAEATYAALWYGLNPVAVFVSAYHGQFDSIPLLFLLLAIYSCAHSAWSTGAWLGLAILTKSWPVLAVPSLLKGLPVFRDKLIFILLVLAVPFAGVLFYSVLFKAAIGPVVLAAVTYNRGLAVWGYTYFLRLMWVLNPASEALFSWFIRNSRVITVAGLIAVWLWKARKETPSAGILTIFVTFFAITHAFAIQYLVWLLPLGLINRDYEWLRRYTIFAYIYMVVVYFTLILSPNITRIMPLPQADWFLIMPLGIPLWVVTILWLAARIKGNTQDSNNSVKNPFLAEKTGEIG